MPLRRCPPVRNPPEPRARPIRRAGAGSSQRGRLVRSEWAQERCELRLAASTGIDLPAKIGVGSLKPERTLPRLDQSIPRASRIQHGSSTLIRQVLLLAGASGLHAEMSHRLPLGSSWFNPHMVLQTIIACTLVCPFAAPRNDAFAGIRIVPV